MKKTLPFSKASIIFILCLLSLLSASCRKDTAHGSIVKNFPRRIISHIPSYTEVLFALGLGPNVVAVDDFSHHPEQVRSLPKVGGLLNPNLEEALALKPDLVVLMGTQTDLIRRYNALGIRTLALYTDTLDQVWDGIEKIGQATGKEAAAGELVAGIRAGLDRVAQKVRDLPRSRTMLVAGHQSGDLREIYVAGPHSFHGALLSIAGGRNIFEDLEPPWGNVSIEKIVERDPEIVLVMATKREVTGEDKDHEKGLWVRLPTLSAVKTDRVVLVGADPMTFPGPRLPQAAEMLSRIIHPEAWTGEGLEELRRTSEKDR